jgi:hypothetical protein
MNKKLFTLITILLLSTPFGLTVDAAEGSVLDSLIPSRKNCNYVDNKQYQPFSDIDKDFPALGKMLVEGKDGEESCVDVSVGTENLLQLFFTTAISIIIILTVVNISVSGIQYMTERATGQIKGGARKRLTDSFIALGLGILSYTILYTVNKQLVNFTFNPASIDLNNSVDKGIESANQAQIGGFSSDLGAIEVILPITPNSPYVAAPGVGGGLVGAYDDFGNIGTPQAPGTSIQARFTNINNSTLNKASADGVISVNGTNYRFRSGGGGNGYLPPGTYTVTNGRLRSDNSTMMVGGFGYSFDLSDAFDPRVRAQRTLLRIHPDGGGPGTIGCIGIQGDRAVQEKFYQDLKNLLNANGGKYTIVVKM